jgi:pimeloyl-ACP methyl ester carboxylesterase
MIMQLVDTLWHRVLNRPYRLALTVDEGRGVPVVLLHGIGRSAHVWQNVITQLDQKKYRALAFDLLGFGMSPKPTWPKYDVDDHARAVIASIEKLRLNQRIILVGHSMGSLIAVRVARLRPDLVKHIVLYEMPLYDGLPEKARYRLRIELYRRFYERVIRYQPTFNAEAARLAERFARKIIGLEVTPETWRPFVRSLQYTILKQTTAEDIRQVATPMDVVYGSFDMLVIRGTPQQFFGDDSRHITAHTIRERHEITPRASRYLVGRIVAAQTGKTAAVIKAANA